MLFQHTWGGSSADVGRGVAVDASGNAYVAGFTYSFGPGNTTRSSLSLLKYNRTGSLLFQRIWSCSSCSSNGTEFSDGEGVAVDRSGSIYVIGRSSSYAGHLNVLLLKFDSNGNMLWQKTWGGTFDNFGRGVAVDGSGNIYVTGDTDSFGFSRDVFLLKFNSTGSLLWQKTWGGTSYDLGEGVAVDSLGNIYVTGTTWSFGAGGADILLLKFDTSGALVWQKTWGGAIDDFGYDVAVDSSENIYVTGYTDSPATGNYALLLKFNSTASLLWQRTWGGSNYNSGYGVALDAAGNVYVTGVTASFGAGGDDVSLSKFDPSGALVWQKTWGGSGADYGNAIAVDLWGNVLVTGSVEEAPPYILGSSVNTPGMPSFALGSPSFTLGSPNFQPLTPTGTVETPSGNQSYSGSADEFLFKYGQTPTITFGTNPITAGSITFNGTPYTSGMNATYPYGTVPISAHAFGEFQFGGWSVTGGITVANANTNSTEATINGPGSLSASFASQQTSTLYLTGIILAGVVTTVTMVIERHRQTRLSRT